MSHSVKSAYDSEDNKKFTQAIFQYVFNQTKGLLAKNSQILDVNAGDGENATRLANNDWQVTALTATPRQSTQQESVINWQVGQTNTLAFDNASFDAVFCWGGLVHALELETTLNEIDRVLKEKGVLILSEPNRYALQVRFNTRVKYLMGKKAQIKQTESGIEYWKTTAEGDVSVTRFMDMDWLENILLDKGYHVYAISPGQFTELYTKISQPLCNKMIHRFNKFWFERVQNSRLAYGNVMVLVKEGKS